MAVWPARGLSLTAQRRKAAAVSTSLHTGALNTHAALSLTSACCIALLHDTVASAIVIVRRSGSTGLGCGYGDLAVQQYSQVARRTPHRHACVIASKQDKQRGPSIGTMRRR